MTVNIERDFYVRVTHGPLNRLRILAGGDKLARIIVTKGIRRIPRDLGFLSSPLALCHLHQSGLAHQGHPCASVKVR
jgi:hypothetical protein